MSQNAPTVLRYALGSAKINIPLCEDMRPPSLRKMVYEVDIDAIKGTGSGYRRDTVFAKWISFGYLVCEVDR